MFINVLCMFYKCSSYVSYKKGLSWYSYCRVKMCLFDAALPNFRALIARPLRQIVRNDRPAAASTSGKIDDCQADLHKGATQRGRDLAQAENCGRVYVFGFAFLFIPPSFLLGANSFERLIAMSGS